MTNKNVKNITEKINNFLLEPNEWVLPNKKEFVNWINETFSKYRSDGRLLQPTSNFSAFKYQKLIRDYMQNKSPYRGILLYHGLGTGKCLKKGTPIIMYNGKIKPVENIEVGDLLMGDDSKPRTVTSLARGRDKMYEIIPTKGEKYTVNSEHILCLRAINNSKEYFKKSEIEIAVKDFIKLPEDIKKNLKCYKVSVSFKNIDLPIDPYILGYWLGQNDSTNSIILKYLGKKNYNIFLENLKELNITNNKHIPHIFKCNSKKNRLRLFEGFMVNKRSSFETKNEKLLDDFIFLASSLGFTCYKKIESSFIHKKKIFSTNVSLLRKNVNSIRSIKVKYVNIDDYYGFTLDGNCRFLFGDFTVTHNTCSAIQVAENLKTQRNVVVMLPASLRTNFITDGLMFCGSKEYKKNPELYKEKYTFISYNANNTVAQIKKIGSLDNKVIIIDEVHNLISKIMSGIMGSSKQGLEIYNYLMNAQNAKIVAMSGTPLINDALEAAILFNILRGYIEITYFAIVKLPNNQTILNNLENLLLQNELIDYLEINKLNKSIEFHLKVKSYSNEYIELINFIQNTCGSNGLIVRLLPNKLLPLFPLEDEGQIFKNYFVDQNNEEGDSLKNEEIFKRRILGLVSYYKSTNESYPQVKYNNYYRIEMSNYQFQIYELLRQKERLSERGGSSSKKKGGKSVKSTFRVFSRQACNFVFPETIYRPYPDPKFIISILKKNNNKSIDINKILLAEEELNNNGKITEDYKSRIDNAIKALTDNGKVYFRAGPEGLDKLSPKMKVILENIEKSPGLIFVYSNFRTLEGVELFSKVLDFNGYSKYGSNNKNNNLKSYAIYSGSEDEKEKKEIINIFTSNENKHGKFIKIILATAAGAEGLDLKNIRQIHIMEPYWNQTRIEQVIGRGVRRNSHILLPPNERNVEVFRYFSIFSDKDFPLTKDKISTDEYIDQVSLKKQTIINQLLLTLKECSFDCMLNKIDTKGDYKCFNFGTGAAGISYYPNISKDLAELSVIQNKKIVKRTLTKGIYCEGYIYLYDIKKNIFYLFNQNSNNPVEIDRKKAKSIYIDKDLNEIYDTKSVNSGNPVRLGFINSNSSKFMKKK